MASCAGSEVFIWDAKTWKCLRKLQGGSGLIYEASFGLDCMSLAVSTQDGKVIIWGIPDE
jgi:hypothetical protein